MSRYRAMLRRGYSVIAALALTLFTLVAVPADAFAASTGRVLASPCLNQRATPGGTYQQCIPYNTTLAIACVLGGPAVTGPYGTESIWDRVTYNGVTGYVSDAWMYTGTNGAVAPTCSKYNRSVAQSWVYLHVWDQETIPNGDCTWFASQSLWAGGLPETSTWARSNWYGSKTQTAIRAELLPDYLVSVGWATKKTIYWGDNTAAGAQIGDLIVYDWNNGADGTIDHISIVTGFNGTYPLVSQHTAARWNRGWSWDPSANNWIQSSHPGSVAYLIHITY